MGLFSFKFLIICEKNRSNLARYLASLFFNSAVTSSPYRICHYICHARNPALAYIRQKTMQVFVNQCIEVFLAQLARVYLNLKSFLIGESKNIALKVFVDNRWFSYFDSGVCHIRQITQSRLFGLLFFQLWFFIFV